MTKLSNPLTEPLGAERPDYAKIPARKKRSTHSFKADPTSLEQMREDLMYDDDSGRVIWLQNPPRGPRKAGTMASSEHPSGHRQIKYRGQILMESHVVWVLTQGEWPSGRLFHRDGVLHNTRIDNLMLETERNKGSGLPIGVQERSEGVYRVSIYKNGRHYLGTFTSIEEAEAQYKAAKKLVHNPKNWAVDPKILLKGLMIDHKNRAKTSQT